MKKYTLSVFCILAFTFSKAQLTQLEWGVHSNGPSSANSTSLVVDDSGNVFSAGYFSGTADFDPDTQTFNLTSAGNLDIFILKLDKMGKFIWAKRMGGNSREKALGIALDKSGNIYTTGYFTTTADFDPGTGIYNLTAEDSTDIFISKLDKSGNFVWARRIGGKLGEEANSIALDARGNVYTTGYFEGKSDFNPDSLLTYNLTSTGGTDIFISKLDASGHFKSAINFAGSQNDRGTAILIDKDGFIYTTGTISGSVNFASPTNGCNYLEPSGNTAAFISKLDSSGNVKWLSESGGNNDFGKSLTIDAAGYVYVMGYGVYPGHIDIIIFKLNSSGSGFWLRIISGENAYCVGNSIVADIFGNIYITGRFQGTAYFDKWAKTFKLTANPGHDDIFILKMDTYGNFTWVQKIGGNMDDCPNAMALDKAGNIYVSGFFSDDVDFDPNSGVYTMDASNRMDMFIIKMRQNSISGIDDLGYANNIQIYPNPSKGIFNIALSKPDNDLSIEVYNNIGIRIKQMSSGETSSIDLSDQVNGLYVIRMVSKDGVIATKKIIKE